MAKLLGFLNVVKNVKGVNHYSVPMTSALLLPKGEKAIVHSGPLTICTFGVVKIFNKKDKTFIGHLFLHQGNEPLALKSVWNKDWAGELIFGRTAPNTQYGENEWTDVDLGKELAAVGIKWDGAKVKDGEAQSWLVTTGTFDVDEDDQVTVASSNTSVFAQPKKPSQPCVLL